MDKLLYKLIKRQKEELFQEDKSHLVSREALKNLNKALLSPLVKVILGPRRCGKSTLAKLALKATEFAYLNFEDEGLPISVTGDDIMTALDSIYPKAKVLFFDEIQNFPRWEQFIHRLHREGRNCLVTGSNAHLLSNEMATALTGRHIAIHLLPFSYREFLAVGHSDRENHLSVYLSHGGFPEIVTEQSDVVAYLGALWDSIILKDVVRRYKIRNVRDLQDLYTLILHSVTSRFNNDSLVRALGGRVSAPTVKKFLAYGQQAFLFSELERFHFGARKRLKFDRKMYVYDNGFLAAKKVSISPDSGRLLENMVFVELVRRGYSPNMNLFYYITNSGYEVDFLTRKNAKIHELIQVTWTMLEHKTREREIKSLLAAAKELKVTKIRILTWDHSETIEHGDVKIRVEPVREWLTNFSME